MREQPRTQGRYEERRETAQAPQARRAKSVLGSKVSIQGNLAIHSCQTVTAVQVAGSVVTGQLESRNDVVRANGVERALQTFMMQIPADRITLFVNLNDMTDADTLLNAAINAGTQEARAPLPNPANPCDDVGI